MKQKKFKRDIYEKVFLKSNQVEKLTSLFLIIVGAIFCMLKWVTGINGLFYFGEGLILSVCVWSGFKLLILHPYWKKLIIYDLMKGGKKNVQKKKIL